MASEDHDYVASTGGNDLGSTSGDVTRPKCHFILQQYLPGCIERIFVFLLSKLNDEVER